MADYSGYEITGGQVLERVEALCRHLTTGGHFTESSPVPASDVLMFLDDSYYWIQGALQRHGYSATQTDTEVLGVLQQIQAYDAAAAVELSAPITDEAGENRRDSRMAARRDRLVSDYLATDSLEQLGATRDRAKGKYLEGTGRSIDRKETVYENNDVVAPRFPRGFGQNHTTPARSGTYTKLADD